MRGSVVKRGKSYSILVELGRDPETRKRQQKWHSGYRTKRDAEAALAEMIGNVNKGTYIKKTRQTVDEFVDEWLAAIEPTVRPATHYSYARNLRLHVLPYIGSAPMTSVDAGTLNGLYARLLAEGRRDTEGGGLSPRSVRYVHTILHRVFKDAVKWSRLARNPSDAADPPRAVSSGAPEMGTWTAEQLRTFLDGTRGDRLHAAWLLLATSGMRRGEALGLRWSDVDLDAAVPLSDRRSSRFSTRSTSAHRRQLRDVARCRWTPRPSPRSASTGHVRTPNDYRLAPAGATSTWCSAESTELRCILSDSHGRSPSASASSPYRRSDFTTCATAGRR